VSIHISEELTEALQESSQASVDLLEAAKSLDAGKYRGATKRWLAAQQRRREIWRAMATPSRPAHYQGNDDTGDEC
jgi:hypothetical protein